METKEKELTNVQKAVAEFERIYGFSIYKIDPDYLLGSWNGETVTVAVNVIGGSSQIGGNNKALVICIHGWNSIYETGSIDVKGVIDFGYTIFTSGERNLTAFAKYYEASKDGKSEYATYTVDVQGSCAGAEEAILSIMNIKKYWVQPEMMFHIKA